MLMAGLVGYGLAMPDSSPAYNSSFPFVISDNVRWEDRGNSRLGEMVIGGPLCPEDCTPLRKPTQVSTRELQPADYASQAHGPITCLSCGKDYFFQKVQNVGMAHDEAETLLMGKRIRAAQGIRVPSSSSRN